jgi:4-amino-4-deoxy-L-arabinose transferase-like glycosyltransferase
MLAAYIPVPAIGLAVLIGTPGSWWRRIGRGVAFGASAIVCSLPWMVVVDLWSKSARPYIGGSTNNTVFDLVFGYNGFGRVDGNGQGGGGQVGGGGLGGPGGVFGGSPGLFRLWNDAVGGQIAWLLPLGVAAAIGALWLHRRDRARMAGVVMVVMWAVICAVVFSYAKGTFHSYYTSELVPGLAATIGIGGVALVKLIRTNRAWLGLVGVALVVTVVIQIDLIGRTPDFFGWTEGLLILLACAAGVVLIVSIFSDRRRVLIPIGLGLALAATLLTPAAWALSETANATLNATLPQAGPRAGTAAGTFGGGQFAGSQNTSLAGFLQAESNGERWDLVVSNAMSASDLIASDDVSVMALGGFIGTDPASTVASIADLVNKGEVRFFQPNGGGFGGFGAGGVRPNFGGGTGATGGATGGTGTLTPPSGTPPAGTPRPNFNPGSGNLPQFPNGGPQGGFGGGGPGAFGGVANDNTAIMSAVRSVCTPVTSASTNGKLPSSYDGQIYDCQGKGAALRAAAQV